VAIDEQHRFGVLQRKRLMDKAVRTATRRTSCADGDADSAHALVDPLWRPRRFRSRRASARRTPIVTRMTTEQHLPGVWEFLRREVAAGHQGYIVYPVIENRSSS